MIYLFNSGFRSKYITNVLNTLHLPEGTNNEYRYSVYNDRSFVDPELLSSLSNDEEVLIIFIDRFSEGGFKFYPMRKGNLYQTQSDEGKLFFKVTLRDYFFPNDLEQFNSRLNEVFKDKIPRLNINMKPDDDGTGFFAFRGESIISTMECIKFSWRETVKILSSLQAFSDENFIFTKSTILNSKNKTIAPKTIKGDNLFSLKVNSQYTYVIDYYFPKQVSDKDSCVTIELNKLSRSFSVRNSIKQIDNESDKISFDITAHGQEVRANEGLILKIIDSKNTSIVNIKIADAEVPIRIVEGLKFWLIIGFIIFILSVLNWLSDLDFKAIYETLSATNAELGNFEKFQLFVSDFITHKMSFYRILFNAINGILTLILFRIFGKKVL